LQAALDLSWFELTEKYGSPSCRDENGLRKVEFAIIAYGKLGGLELGYGSDLDLVFLNDSEGETQHTDGEKQLENPVFLARLTRRIIHILTMATTSGSLYEVDTRLRPSGKSGLLVSSLAAFDRYQLEDAWTWEHQALLRSRAVAGSPAMRQSFEKLRKNVLTNYVRRDTLQKDVTDMRQRMRLELCKGTDELFDLKQDVGGVTDIEFIVQFLVLKEAHNHSELVHFSDNIRQLESLVQYDIMTADDKQVLTDIYRTYRSRMHHLSLAGSSALVPRESVAELSMAVKDIWDRVFA